MDDWRGRAGPSAFLPGLPARQGDTGDSGQKEPLGWAGRSPGAALGQMGQET